MIFVKEYEIYAREENLMGRGKGAVWGRVGGEPRTRNEGVIK